MQENPKKRVLTGHRKGGNQFGLKTRKPGRKQVDLFKAIQQPPHQAAVRSGVYDALFDAQNCVDFGSCVRHVSGVGTLQWFQFRWHNPVGSFFLSKGGLRESPTCAALRRNPCCFAAPAPSSCQPFVSLGERVLRLNKARAQETKTETFRLRCLQIVSGRTVSGDDQGCLSRPLSVSLGKPPKSLPNRLSRPGRGRDGSEVGRNPWGVSCPEV